MFKSIATEATAAQQQQGDESQLEFGDTLGAAPRTDQNPETPGLATAPSRGRRPMHVDGSSSLAIFKSIVGDTAGMTDTAGGALRTHKKSKKPPGLATIPSKNMRPAPAEASSLATSESIVEEQVPQFQKLHAIANNFGFRNDVNKFRYELRKGRVAAGFNFFDETLSPQLAKPGIKITSKEKVQLRSTFKKDVYAQKAKDFASSDLPSVSRITEASLELGIFHVAQWTTLVMHLMQYICQLSTSPDDYTTIENYETAMARRDDLLHDLLGAWKVFTDQITSANPIATEAASSEEATTSTESASSTEAGTSTGKVELVRKIEQMRTPELLIHKTPGEKSRRRISNFQEAFASLFPNYARPSLLQPSWAAFATYLLLTDPFNRNRSVRDVAYPFRQMISRLLPQAQIPSSDRIKLAFNDYPDLQRYALHRFDVRDKKGAMPVRTSTQIRSYFIHRMLGQAIKGRNLSALDRTWEEEFWGKAAEPDASKIGSLRVLPQIFDYFILAYMGLRQTQKAIDVWDKMERVGIKPTIRTWNSMLRGCTMAKNAAGIATVWERLVTSGIQLDTAIWTARISGLIFSGDPEAGILALNEMAQIWREKDKPENAAIAVKLTTEPINAALAGLLRLDRTAAATSVLSWAGRQGVEPDIYTFNTLLRPAVRQGKTDDVHEIFDMMKQLNVEANAATLTILLDGALDDIGVQSPDEQVEVVTRIIRDMETKGIELNMQTYAKMIYLLLKEGGDRAGGAVKAVLADIWGRGLELSSHIYTMLAMHYFSRDPPDAAAVTALIENRRLHNNRDIDRVFWERVIKGYCQVGETERAWGIFQKVFASGTNITFSTLHDLLLALLYDGREQSGKELVMTALNIKEANEKVHGTQANGAQLMRFWKHRFWHLAWKEGLLAPAQLASVGLVMSDGGQLVVI
ncbi:hypothetical protein B0H67DRAFT_647010 [Lasiosphaeris hirsuta]|uniref:Pentatricopeptide repeat-containing protein n=1 Tax=Lasiosphaeris hirsuta TaxID=260670 RepID=A0AA40A9D6_9PEZI|nr:hypothetical protein B0H67DRAFT_647010 [Lasiosphaeris hirsuta]